jgi:hypothetical protein
VFFTREDFHRTATSKVLKPRIKAAILAGLGREEGVR